MDGIKNVTLDSPCPVCGSNDWCYYSNRNKYGRKYLYCHRERPDIGTVCNGYYCFLHTNECSVWETVEDHESYNKFDKKSYNKKMVRKTLVPKVEERQKQPIADAKVCNLTYRALLSLLKLEDEDRKYLHSEGFTDEMIKKYSIVSIPPRDADVYNKVVKSSNPYRIEICRALLKQGCSLEHVPGFGINANKKWTMYGPGGIVFPVYNFSGEIVQLRVRAKLTKDDINYYLNVAKRKPPKYMHFASGGKTLGAACNNTYSVYEPAKKTSICFITEGEKKGIMLAEKRGVLGVALQGVNSYKGAMIEKDSSGKNILDYLKEYGIKIIIICYDADKAVNKYVLGSETGTIKELKNHGFRIGVANWNMNIAKGIDDLINLGLNPSLTMLKD